MSRTREDIITELRQATQGPLGPRSLARAIAKGLGLIHELRADSSWEQIAELFNDSGLPATAESIRRSVRREEDRDARRRQTATRPTAPRPNSPASAAHPAVEIEGLTADRQQIPPATGPPPTPRINPPLGAIALVAGGAFLDQISKLRDLDK